MASTDQVRRWYPDVVTNHASRGQPGYQPVCDTTKAVRVDFPKEGGGVYRLLVHPATADAWRVYARLMTQHGETVPSAGGTHNCRNIANTNWPSLHAYCVALDLPPNNRKSAAFQSAVLAVRTNTGAQVWRNLASADDRMHDEITCSPTDLASGIAVDDDEGDDDMTPAQFAARLSAEQVDALVDAKGVGGVWVISPGSADRASIKSYYKSILGQPTSADWVTFFHEVYTEALVNSAIHQAGAPGGSGPLTLAGTLTGTFKGTGKP